MKILVIGGTGMLGRPVVRELVGAGYTVRCLVRDVSKAAKLLPSNVELMQGDLHDAASIKRAAAHQDAAYLNLSVPQKAKETEWHAEGEGLKAALPVLREAGIGRVGYLSSLVMNYQGMNGFDWWIFRIKHDAVKSVKESGIPWMIFYPSSFMENMSGNYRRGDSLALVGNSPQKMWWIAGSDYGKQVAKAFARPESANRDYNVQGPDGLSQREAAEIFAANYPLKKLKVTSVPEFVLKGAGIFDPVAAYATKILTALNRYPETFVSADTWSELGIPTVKIAEFAKTAP